MVRKNLDESIKYWYKRASICDESEQTNGVEKIGYGYRRNITIKKKPILENIYIFKQKFCYFIIYIRKIKIYFIF